MQDSSSSHTRLVPAKVAAEAAGYTTDYVGLLARQGKIFGQKIGRQWHVNRDEVIRFAYEAGKEQSIRRAELKAERKIEYLFYAGHIEQELAFRIEEGKTPALIVAVFILMFMIATGTAGILRSSEMQVASLPSVDFSGIKSVAVSLYRFVGPQTSKLAEQTAAMPVSDTLQRSRSYHLTSIAETVDTESAIRDAFSDELDVRFDPEVNDSGVIVPKFKNESESEYRFRLLIESPVETDQ